MGSNTKILTSKVYSHQWIRLLNKTVKIKKETSQLCCIINKIELKVSTKC